MKNPNINNLLHFYSSHLTKHIVIQLHFILGSDISMWLHQFSKGIRDGEGNPLAKAHLIGLFKRICKLLFYGIKPVFVFDGSVPILKKQTIVSGLK